MWENSFILLVQLGRILIVAVKIVSVHTLKHSNSILRKYYIKYLNMGTKTFSLQLCVYFKTETSVQYKGIIKILLAMLCSCQKEWGIIVMKWTWKDSWDEKVQINVYSMVPFVCLFERICTCHKHTGRIHRDCWHSLGMKIGGSWGRHLIFIPCVINFFIVTTK